MERHIAGCFFVFSVPPLVGGDTHTPPHTSPQPTSTKPLTGFAAGVQANNTGYMERALKKAGLPTYTVPNYTSSPTPPSPDDFRKAFENNYSIGVIVGHNGQVYVYSNTSVKLTREQTEQMADDIAMLYRMGWDIDRASRLIYDDYGLVYTIVERDD